MKRGRVALAFALSLLAAAASPDRAGADRPVLEDGVSASDYNAAGIAINKALKSFGTAFASGDPAAAELLLDAEFGAGRPVPSIVQREADERHGVRIWRWEAGPSLGTDREAAQKLLVDWRARFASLEMTLFKLHFLDRLEADGTATARFRFELLGRTTEGEVRSERGMFRGRFARHEKSRELLTIELIEGETVVGPGDHFVETARARGIDFVDHADGRFLPPSQVLRDQAIRHAVGGVNAADVDGDGDDDLFLLSGEEPRLFINDGTGRFEDHTEAAGLTGLRHATAAIFGDLDEDGDRDLYVGFFYGRNRLFRNDGAGRFSDVTDESGLPPDDMTSALALADLDGDGHLDLYVGRFLDAKTRIPDMIHYSRNGAPNRLYLGNGDLTFRDVSEASGADDVGLTLGIAIADYDGDGDQDVYLANDFGRNLLLRNRGDATFDDVAKESGAMAVSAGMAASFGDYDGDGLLDLYVSSIRSNQRWFSQGVNIRFYILNIVQSARRPRLQEVFLDLRKHLGDRWEDVGNFMLGGNWLLRNRGDGTFEDVSDAANARPQGWYWSSGFIDVDNDGWLDLLAANGWITNPLTADL